MKIAIVDDEPLYIQEIKKHLKDICKGEPSPIISTFLSAKDFISSIENNIYDIVFLDIETNEENYSGIIAAHELRRRYKENIVKIIFVSAYESYHKRLYELRPVGFISKPICYEEVYSNFKKCLATIDGDSSDKSVFTYQKQNSVLRIPQRDILYFESERRKKHIVTFESRDTFYSTNKDMLSQLDANFFIQPHESYIINLNMVKEFRPDGFVMKNGKTISISRKRSDEIRDVIGRFLKNGIYE